MKLINVFKFMLMTLNQLSGLPRKTGSSVLDD